MISRALDIAIGLTGSVISAPVVALLMLLIRLESAGSPLYRQTRVGRDGRPFEIYKLRTMITGAEFQGAGLAIAEGDDRITRVGAFVRRYSLDELPNFWNVLRGDMAIVGPRPTVEGQVHHYTPRQRGRLGVRPGITGWAQINGRASLPWPERIELDLWYVEHRSVRLDLEILARTIRQVAAGHGIYKGAHGGWRTPEDTPVAPPAETPRAETPRAETPPAETPPADAPPETEQVQP
jgi:lipopolysaccharide/colanic/teichoic acid biosynthesis glycosyltransferase